MKKHRPEKGTDRPEVIHLLEKDAKLRTVFIEAVQSPFCDLTENKNFLTLHNDA